MVYLCRGCTEMPLLHWPNAAFIEEAHNVDVFVLVGHLNEHRVVDALSEGKIVLHIVKEPDAGVVILEPISFVHFRIYAGAAGSRLCGRVSGSAD